MPIKSLVAVLALVAALSFMQESPVFATAERAVSSGAGQGISKTKYKVSTNIVTTIGTTAPISTSILPLTKSKDNFKVLVSGMSLRDGDAISFTFTGDRTCDIGSPTFTGFNPGLQLFANKASGAIGAFPNIFPKAKLTYNAKKQTLTFKSGNGVAPANPRTVAAPSKGTTGQVTIVVHTYRPGDAVPQADFTFNANFTIKATVKTKPAPFTVFTAKQQ